MRCDVALRNKQDSANLQATICYSTEPCSRLLSATKFLLDSWASFILRGMPLAFAVHFITVEEGFICASTLGNGSPGVWAAKAYHLAPITKY